MAVLSGELKRFVRGSMVTPIILQPEVSSYSMMTKMLSEIGLNVKILERFNFISAVVPSNLVEPLLDIKGVSNIYLDRVMSVPEIKQMDSVLDLPRSLIGLGVLNLLTALKKRPVSEANSTVATFKQMGIDEAREDGYFGQGMRVGIVDSDEGLRILMHPQIRRRALSFSVRRSVRGSTLGHGSHVGTTIQGIKIDLPKFTVEGGAPQSTGVYVKALLSPIGTGTVSDILKGIDIALQHQCRVLNLSLGGPPAPSLEEDPFHIGLSRIANQAVYVAAAGNDGKAEVGSPANSPHTIAISALDPNTGELADFSNYGPEIDFTAPGVNILSGIANETLLDVMGQGPPGFSTLSGTSMATPHAAALFTLMAQALEQKGVRLTTDRIRDMAAKYGQPHTDTKGYGLLTWQIIKQYVATVVTSAALAT